MSTATEFYTAHRQDIIAKYIASMNVVFQGEAICSATVLVPSIESLQRVDNCPTLLQERVAKKLELRVTIIGQKIFTVAYDTSRVPEASVDGRQIPEEDYDKVPHFLFTLPTEIEHRLVEMMKGYGLNYAAIDLILTPDNRYVF